MAKKKRIAVISDNHCGHEAGLTPPDWWYDPNSKNSRIAAINAQQRAMWRWYTKTVMRLQPVDILFHLGDNTAGKNSRQGGRQLRTSDENEQAKMAAECILVWKAPRIAICYGTPYHTGNNQDNEDVVAKLVEKGGGKVEISGQHFIEVNGVCFDLKHFVSSSSIPHGRWTPLVKDKLWNQIWHAEHKQQPDADYVIRGHVHYCIFGGDFDNWEAMTCPALMGFGDIYGVRMCRNTVHVGLWVFDIDEKGNVHKWPERLVLKSHQVKALKW